MDYSPKLREAARKIKQILKQANIAGCVVLHTPGYVEFFDELSPSYSAVKYTLTPDGKKQFDFNGKNSRDTEATLAMLFALWERTIEFAEMYQALHDQIKTFDILKKSGNLPGTSAGTIDN
jgi:hypothetical protein